MDDKLEDSSRRRVLNSLAGGSAALVGTTGLASAEDDRHAAKERRIFARYRSTEDAVKTVREECADLLTALSERGYLAEPSLSAFDTGQVVGTNAGDEAGVLVTVVEENDGPTGVVMASADVDGTEIKLVSQPEAGRNYSIVRDGDGGVEVFEMQDGAVMQQQGCEVIGPKCLGIDFLCTQGSPLGPTNGSWDILVCDNGDCYKDAKQGCCYFKDRSCNH